MCLNPKWIYKKGRYKEDNYRGKKDDFYEIGTYSKCGYCEQCINSRCNDWVVRNYWESKAHEKISFVTLTYKESPIILVRKDFQDWKKRFRIELDRTTSEKVRFFECGEYGSRYGRPHAHFIIYGWTDENAKYFKINKKKQIVYVSEIINETWGLGFTSYQKFNANEIPYITLYNTPQEDFKRAYKLTHEKVKKLRELALNPRMNENQRKNLIEELNAQERALDEENAKYKAIREYQSWSKGLGWKMWYEDFKKNKNHAFVEYINGKEFVTPTSYVKRAANLGHENAIAEMYRREQLIQATENEQEERAKNIQGIYAKKKAKIIEWNDKKTVTEDIF